MPVFHSVLLTLVFVFNLVTAPVRADQFTLNCGPALVEFGDNRRLLSSNDVRPLQMEVGDEAVEMMLNAVLKDSADVTLIQTFLSAKPLPGVVLPNHEVRILDGHHRARLMALAESKGLVKRGELRVTVEIKRNYALEGFTMERAMGDLDHSQNLYVTPEVRRRVRSREITWEQTLMVYLPKSVHELKDNSKRSLMGAAFREMGVDSTKYKNFIEFFLAEELEAAGFEFPQEITIRDAKLVGRVVDRLKAEDMKRFLLNSER